MNQVEIISEAVLFVSGQIELPPEKVDVKKDLKSMGLDSFRIIELVLFLERRSGISFPDYAYTPENLKSLDAIVSCLMKTVW